MKSTSISSANKNFWNELCGTQPAKAIDISDSSPASRKKFDDWHFDFYPYLFDRIPFDKLKNKDVLWVSLGYAHRKLHGYRDVVSLSASRDRIVYAKNSSGDGAPYND
jgi:hypothetical protein